MLLIVSSVQHSDSIIVYTVKWSPRQVIIAIFKNFSYLFGRTGSQLQHAGSFLARACYFCVRYVESNSWPGIEPALHWKHRVLVTRPPGNKVLIALLRIFVIIHQANY